MVGVDWRKVNGLLPVIVQESSSGEILMFAYMNEEALSLSLSTGLAHYFSRTRNRLWKKGEESGNTQIIDEIFLDCDNDTLLLKVTQNGGSACHTGAKSCFFRKIDRSGKNTSLSDSKESKKSAYGIIDEIYHVILDRKLNADPQKSYVAGLFKKGENTVLKKIGEETAELITACKDAAFEEKIAETDKGEFKTDKDPSAHRSDVVYEAADLCFHVLIALAARGIHPDQIKAELASRFGLSGIEEKNSRNG